jgi:hypothetical protein
MATILGGQQVTTANDVATRFSAMAANSKSATSDQVAGGQGAGQFLPTPAGLGHLDTVSGFDHTVAGGGHDTVPVPGHRRAPPATR